MMLSEKIFLYVLHKLYNFRFRLSPYCDVKFGHHLDIFLVNYV